MIPHPSLIHISATTVLGLATIAGFYAGRAARKLRLPSIIGYMVLGIFLGPSLLNIYGEGVLEELSFITELTLGFIAFTIGAELSLSSMKRLGPGIVTIIFTESFMAFFVVGLALYLLTRDLPLALIFGAMAPASAPAGTVAVIHECRASGSLTKALYAVVGFDDGLAIIIYGIAYAFSKSLLMEEGIGVSSSILALLWGPVKEVGLSFLLGGIAGKLLCMIIGKLSKPQDIFIIIFCIVLLITGLSDRWHLSLILTNMTVGFVLANSKHEAFVKRVKEPLLEIMPLLFIMFFCLAGAHLDIRILPSLGIIGTIYILARSAGLMGGASIGAVIGHSEEKIRKYLGFGILSQAGVAIGLSLIVKSQLLEIDARYGMPHAADIGATVLTTITASSIIFEIVGPVLTRYALKKAGEAAE